MIGEPMQVYLEIYNLSEGTTDRGKSLVLGYALKDTAQQVVRTYPATRIPKPGPSAVKTASLATEDIDLRSMSFGFLRHELVLDLRVHPRAGAEEEPTASERGSEVAPGTRSRGPIPTP